ncbi:MAG: NRDE family protein [Bacteroidota bacterium]
MCTVTYIPVKEKILITSSRDEKNAREEAVHPSLQLYNETKLVFPRDAAAGGTWIAMKENGDAAVLLNGAFFKHAPSPAYRQSRGIILLDVLSAERPSLRFTKIDLGGIEPFTLILFESGSLFEFRWDGNEKYCKQLTAGRPHIWSSTTLYDGFVIKKREHWFAKFLNRNPSPTQQDVVNFHRFSGDGDKRNDLLMRRDDVYSTVSITSILLTHERGSMKYLDIIRDRLSEIKIELLQLPEAV